MIDPQTNGKQSAYTPPPLQKFGSTLSSDYLESNRGKVTDDVIADQMAAASPHFAGQLKKIRTKFGNDPSATTALLNKRFYGSTSYTPTAPPDKKGYVGRTLDRIYNAGIGVREDLDAYNRGETTSGQAVIRTGSQIARGILSPATEAISTATDFALDKTGLGQKIGEVAQDVINSDVGQAVKPYVENTIESYNNLPEGSGFRDLADIGRAGLDFLDVYGAGKALSVGSKALGAVAKTTAQTVRHPIQAIRGAKPLLAADEVRKLTGTAEQAVKKGMDEKLMTFVADQAPDTRAVMAKMTKAANEGGKVLGGTVKHKEILGGQMLDNIAYVLDEKETVGKALTSMKNTVADDLFNLSDDYHNLMTELRNKGAVINDKGKIVSLAGAADDNIPILQQTLDFMSPDDVGNVVRSGKGIDQWRTKMFQEMNSAKAKLQPSANGQSVYGFAEEVTNKMRRAAIKKVAKGNKNLLALNDAFEELSTESNKFLKSIQYKGKLNVDAITSKQLRAGEIALRSLGNAAGEPRAAFESIIATAKKYGRISNIDEMALIRYADSLEDVFPITPTRSLQGSVSRGTRDALGNFTEDIVEGKGLTTSFVNRVMEPVMGVYDKMRGLTPEYRYKLLMEVLEAPPETSFFNIMKKVLPDEMVDKISKDSVKGIEAKDISTLAKKIASTDEAFQQSSLPTQSTLPLQKTADIQLGKQQLLEMPDRVQNQGNLTLPQTLTSASPDVNSTLQSKGNAAMKEWIPELHKLSDEFVIEQKAMRTGDESFMKGYGIGQIMKDLNSKKAFKFLGKKGASFEDVDNAGGMMDGYQAALNQSKPQARVDTIKDMIKKGYQGLNEEHIIDEHGNTLKNVIDEYERRIIGANDKRQATRLSRVNSTGEGVNGRNGADGSRGTGGSGLKNTVTANNLPDVVKNNMGLYESYISKGMTAEQAAFEVKKYVENLPF